MPPKYSPQNYVISSLDHIQNLIEEYPQAESAIKVLCTGNLIKMALTAQWHNISVVGVKTELTEVPQTTISNYLVISRLLNFLERKPDMIENPQNDYAKCLVNTPCTPLLTKLHILQPWLNDPTKGFPRTQYYLAVNSGDSHTLLADIVNTAFQSLRENVATQAQYPALWRQAHLAALLIASAGTQLLPTLFDRMSTTMTYSVPAKPDESIFLGLTVALVCCYTGIPQIVRKMRLNQP